MHERPWTTEEIERLVSLLSGRISPFGFTVKSTPSNSPGLTLNFHPLGIEEIKTRTSGLIKYLREIWGNATPLQGPSASPHYIRAGAPPYRLNPLGNDEDQMDRLDRLRAEAARLVLEERQQDAIDLLNEVRGLAPNPFQQDAPFAAPPPPKADPKKGRYRYAFTRPDGGKITTVIF